LISIQLNQKCIFVIFIALIFVFTASFATAATGGEPLPGTECKDPGEEDKDFRYVPPPYMGTLTVEWTDQDECVLISGTLSKVGNDPNCDATLDNFLLTCGMPFDTLPPDYEGPVFIDLKPSDLMGICNKELKNYFPCVAPCVQVPGGGCIPARGMQVVAVSNIKYLTEEYDKFTARFIMMPIVKKAP
jgi:hypothetical protein